MLWKNTHSLFLELNITWLIISFCLLGILNPQKRFVIRADINSAVKLKPGLFGTATYANLAGKKIDDPNMMDIMHNIKPPVLRIPGGNAMNYWDWNAGLPKPYDSLKTFIVNPHSCDISKFNLRAKGTDNSRRKITTVNGPLIGEKWYKLAIEGGSKIIWGINVSTSRTDETLKFLKYLKSKNIMPEMFELGNELYFDTWSCEVPSSEYYVQLAKKHGKIIKQLFPKARIAVPVFANYARVNPYPAKEGIHSIRNWNEALYPDQSFYDAVVIHIYFCPFTHQELGSSNEPTKDEVVRWGAIRSSIETMHGIMNWVKKYWPCKEIWMTEWALNNFNGYPKNFGSKYYVQHTVFGALFTANVILNTASFKSQITNANFWQIYGSNFGMISASGIKRPVYYVYKFLSDAIHTANKIERIDINNAPLVRGPGKFNVLSAPLFDAYAFFDNNGKVMYYVFVNKMDSPVNINIPGYNHQEKGTREYFTTGQNSDILPGWGNKDNPVEDDNWHPVFTIVKDTVKLNSFTIPKWSFSVMKVK